MPTNPNSGFDFAALMTSAQTAPGMPEQGGPGTSAELPPTVQVPKPQNRMYQPVMEEKKPGVSVPMLHHSRVFTLWQPWDKCKRCLQMIDDGTLTLPLDEGDIECPHTHRSDYKAIMDMGLNGDCVVALKEVYTLPNGKRMVHVEWMTPNETKLRQMERDAKARTENQVYPPRPFADPPGQKK